LEKEGGEVASVEGGEGSSSSSRWKYDARRGAQGFFLLEKKKGEREIVSVKEKRVSIG